MRPPQPRPGRLHRRRCARPPPRSRATALRRRSRSRKRPVRSRARGGPGSPRRERSRRPPARRREPARSPRRASARPRSEMPDERFQHHRRGDLAKAFFRERGGRKFRPLRRRVEIDPDTDHDKVGLLGPDRLGFEQDAGELTAVRPARRSAICTRAAEPRQHAASASPTARAPRQSRAAPRCRSGRRAATSATVEIARRRDPGAAAPPAPGGLLVRPDQGAVGRAVAGQRFASSLVLPIESKRQQPIARGSDGGLRSSGKERQSRRVGAADDRIGKDEKEHRHDTR